MARIAVVLFNLGGPDTQEAVQPFLFNLFNDPAIIGAPALIRWFIAKLIAKRRAPIAREIYGKLGGGSPLLPLTQEQARALESVIADIGDVRVFVAMRYWHPRADVVAQDVIAWQPDEIVLLPLYPQFSTATTASSLDEWQRVADEASLNVPTRSFCCYPVQNAFVEALVDVTEPMISAARGFGEPRVLFSAHGLPKRTVARGDPYQWQVEATADAVAKALADRLATKLDWVVCYQSRVGPLEWIGPSTEDEIIRGGADGVPIVIVPIAFVSEHSETLVELDIEYRQLAQEQGVSAYYRVPALATNEYFIRGLGALVRAALEHPGGSIVSESKERLCPSKFVRCAMDGERGA